MTVTLNLPVDLERGLNEEAARLKLTLPEYLSRLLAERNAITPPPRNGAELVEYWQREGLVGSRPDIVDPEAYARELRSSAERRDLPRREAPE